MTPENSKSEQNEQLREMNYSPENDIFNQEEAISLDGDGNPIDDQHNAQSNILGSDLDVPGSSQDDNMENIGSEDEENNYYSQSDNNDNHEEVNDDLVN